jgi:arylsulfatase A
MRIILIIFAVFCLIFTEFVLGKEPILIPDNRPNIIYILADDMGYGDVGIYNPESKIPTPNLDALAAAGMRFTDAHSPASVCTPTRYGIMTGEYAWRSKRLKSSVLRGYGHAMIETGRTTVASLLNNIGYQTGIVGKWHLGLNWKIKPKFKSQFVDLLPDENGHMVVRDTDPRWIDFSQAPVGGPRDIGFDYSYILPASLDMPPYAYLENDKLIENPSQWIEGHDTDTGYTKAFWRAGHKAPSFVFDDVLPTFTQKAVSFISEKSTAQAPYFLYVPFAGPHTPWLPTDNFKGKSQAGMYGDFVNMVDDAIGQILAAVVASGEAENTLIVFTSDNGPFWQPRHSKKFNHSAVGIYRGMKADTYEGGHRMPFIVSWPNKIKANSVSQHLTVQTNLMATLADIIDESIPSGVGKDSVSILPTLLGKDAKQVPELVVHQSSKNMMAIRAGDWKLILGLGSGGFTQPRFAKQIKGGPAGQLFNLAEDPSETTNVYLKYPKIVSRLKKTLKRKMQ